MLLQVASWFNSFQQKPVQIRLTAADITSISFLFLLCGRGHALAPYWQLKAGE